VNLRIIAIAASFAVFPILGAFSFMGQAYAATENCTITASDVGAITTAQANGLIQELAARRTLLTRIISCAKTEALSLQTDLNNMPADNDTKTLQSQFYGKLGDAANYYDIELSKVNDSGIAGTKAIANEALSWRKANYDTLANQISNFILWSQNQALFRTAEGRFTQIGRIVSFLEGAAQNTDLEGVTAIAQTSFTNAKNANSDAKNALTQFLPPDQSLSLIQESLQLLSDSYQKFFDVSNVLQKLLSTAKTIQP